MMEAADEAPTGSLPQITIRAVGSDAATRKREQYSGLRQ